MIINQIQTIISKLNLDHFAEVLSLKKDFNFRNKFQHKVDDNYANHQDYGFYTGDDSNALSHACLMLNKLDRFTEASEDERTRWKDALALDFDNYLKCHLYGIVKTNLNIENLTESMIAFGLGDYVIDSIRAYYEKLITDEMDYDCFVPAYEDLYIQAGDRALFFQQNLAKALEYYILADIDWFHLRDGKEKRNLDGTRRQKLLQWHEKVVSYQQLKQGSYKSEEVTPKKGHDQNIFDPYVSFTSIVNEQTQSREIVEAAATYLVESNERLKQKDIEIDYLRDNVFMALLVKRDALLSSLCCLKEDIEIKPQEIADQIIDAIKRIDSIPLRLVKSYVIDHEEDDDIVDDIINFSLTINTVSQIRLALRVEKLAQDMAYYTSMDNFLYMLPAKCGELSACGRFSIMNIAYMNDPNEGTLLQKYINKGNELRETNTGRKTAIYPYVFMKCFTTRVDDLPMWEMYGDHAKGCCILVDWDASERASKKKSVPLYRVCYIKKNPSSKYTINMGDNPQIEDIETVRGGMQKLKTLLEEIKTDDARDLFEALLQGITYLFKENIYYYEQEMRILYTFSDISEEFMHTKNEYPMLYVQPDFPIHIKEIILGPKFSNAPMKMPYIKEQVAKMSYKIGADMPIISFSGIEYR